MHLQTDQPSDRAASDLKRKISHRYGGVAAMLALGLALLVGACSSGSGRAEATNPVPYMSKDSRHFLLSVQATPTPAVTVAVPTPTPIPEPTATPAPTSVPVVTDGATPTAEDPVAEPTATPTPTEESTDGPDQEELIAQGKLIFLETAGGVGCQYCHGPDGSGMVGPDIRGATGLMVQGALDRAPDMLFITLEPWEFYAIEAYLATLVP
jgi:mono/diheme cytochrome c family protein